MAAHENVSGHQFGEMTRRLSEEGGFTYDPRKQSFVTEGYSVAAHPAAELTVPEATEAHLRGYVAGSAPLWKGQKAKGKGQEMIGGWRPGVNEPGEVRRRDVLDVPKVFPATPAGHTKSREAQILRNQESSFVLHEGEPEANPWFTGSKSAPPGRLSAQFPEYAGSGLRHPEVSSWAERPAREAQWDREAKRQRR